MPRQYAQRARTNPTNPAGSTAFRGGTHRAGRGNQARQEDQGLAGAGGSGPDEAWVQELLQVAPVEEGAGTGAWGQVQERAVLVADGDGGAEGSSAQPQQGGGSTLSDRLAELEARLAEGDVAGITAAAHALADEARALLAAGTGDSAALQAVIAAAGELWSQARTKEAGELGITEQGRSDLARMAAAASSPWYSRPLGKCYAAVAGYGPSAYVNRAGGRWKQLADRIPGSHASWAVSFAHWLQETAHGQRAAEELGFEIRESDGRTRLGDYLAQHPELKGAIVVIPYGQQGTASREWNAAAAYGDAKWGAGVGDISVVTAIGERGATYVADAVIPHDQAVMWWVVYPR